MRSPTTSRHVAWGTLVLGALGFVVLALLVVPWQPVPGGIPKPVAAGELFSSEELARAEAYASTARLLSWSSLAVSLLVACWLGFTSAGARLVGGRGWPWPVTVVGSVAAVLMIGRLATLPFGVLMHRHRVENGLSTQGLDGWLVDQVKGVSLGVLFTSLALLLLVGCARRWAKAWPAVAGGVVAALVVMTSFVYPLVVEPVFNSFTPLAEGELRSEIVALADEEGVVVDDVLVADASRRTTTLNAYVSGFGATRRVVVYDTLLESAPGDEVLPVVAHELAHVRHGDVLKGTALGALGALGGVGLLALVLGSSRLRRRSGTAGMQDPAVVALVLALTTVGGLLASPVENGISRRVELRADVVALEATGDGEAFVEMQRRLCLRALCDPTPPAWSQAWFGSHPTVLERVGLRLRTGR